MAIIKTQPVATGEDRFPLEQSGPTGTYPATLVDIKDSFEVEVPSHDNPQVMTKKDVTCFLFAYLADEKVHLAQTWPMTQSRSERGNLYKLLRSLKGENPQFDDTYDYVSELGTNCQITVSSKVSKKGTHYTVIDSVSQILSELKDRCPKIEEVEIPGGRQSPILDADGNPF